jgi:hypothetical protein
MKKSKSNIRPFANARWLTISIVGILVAGFITSPALMQNRQETEAAPVKPAANVLEREGLRVKQELFVDEEEAESEAEFDDNAPQAGDTAAFEIPKVYPAVFDGDVRKLPVVPQSVRPFQEPEEPRSKNKDLLSALIGERATDPNVALAAMPAPLQNFPGLSRTDTCTGGPCGAGIPPDTNGDVGPNHYIQSVNTAVGIYNKTGTLLASFTFNSLWSGAGTGTACDANNTGDPVVLYDSMADRWIVTDFAFAVNGSGNPIRPYYQCLAVSKTGDPVAGGWYLYPVLTDTGATGQPPTGVLNDYPHFGIWTDCLYYSGNGFNNASSFAGVEFGSFSKADMYSGAALTGALGFIAGATNFALLPANLSAPASGLPPLGTPEYFVSESATAFSWDVRKFTPGTHCGGGGSMSAATNVTQPAYTVPGANIVPQPNDAGSLHNLDSLGDRLMQKAQYRKVGAVESIWVSHTTRSSGTSNTQPGWAQLDVSAGTIALAPTQQQNYAPDLTLWRWMPSIAADKDGNAAMGYSTSNATSPNFPSIAYSGRLVGDTLNQLPQSETQLVAGLGSELNNCGGAACHRWGDYSSMSVDPTDSCTFWLTNEYYTDQTNGSAGAWNTRVGSFVFPTCTAAVSAPTVPAAPTGLSFTNVTATSMTLNWTDVASNEDSYVIYRSTDNVNFTFAAQTAANAVLGNVTGLNPSTIYFFRVFAAKNGQLSSPLTGSQATSAPGAISSTGAGGLWSQTSTWASGIVPTVNDNVTIVNGATVTIDIAAVALNVTVGSGAAATLQFIDTSAQSLTVGQGVTVSANGIFQSATSGIVTTHVLTVGTDLTNSGTINFSTNTNLAGAGIIFTGASAAAFTLNGGSTTNLKQTTGVTLNKGVGPTSILTFTPGGTFTVLGANAVGFLAITSGTFKISGSNAFSNPVFSAAGYSIPGPGGFWLNNTNASVVGQNGSPAVSGLLRITLGTLNVGIAIGNSMGLASGATIIVEGGAVNTTGRFGVSTSTNAINYTQNAGTVIACTIGHTSTTLACFDMGTSVSSDINISAGTIVIQIASTAASGPRDYRNQAGAGISAVTGGTVQLGNAASGAAKAFNIAGVFPNLVLTNTSANHTATMLTPAVYNNITRNLTISSGTTMNLGNFTFLFDGTTLTNHGTLTHNGASSNFIFFLTTSPVSYTGTGTVTAPMTNFTMQADSGLTIDPASPNISIGAMRMFSGNITNSNKITLGNGGATTGIVQIGNTTTPTNAGTFDVPFTFNLGTGGEIISYLRTTLTRTTGPEVTPTRILTSMTYDDNDPTHALTIAGGDLSVNAAALALTLTTGRIITGANTLIMPVATSTVTRTSGYVDGNFRKNFSAAASKVFEVGTANGYSPLTANVTAGSFPTNFTAKAIEGAQPSVNPLTSIKRYWTLTAAGITADLTFQYLLGDLAGTEANYKVIRVIGVSPTAFPASTVNTVAHTATLVGANSFSDWTVGEPTFPTAAAAGISGTITTAAGMPLPGVTLRLAGGHSATAISNNKGYFQFDNVSTDSFYTLAPELANYHFTPSNRSFSLLGNKTDAAFAAVPDSTIGGNAIDATEYFVRQQYLDFLGREPDQGGFEYWSNEINRCGADAACASARRVDVAAAFFIEREFQETGAFVNGLYKGSYGYQPSYKQFTGDRAKVVGGLDLDARKTALAEEWVQRDSFRQAYPNSLTPEQFVNKLFANAGLVPHEGEWETYVNRLSNGGTRAQVLRLLADNSEFRTREYNANFVLMEYFAYLHRDPEPEGYAFWLDVLNFREVGNFRGMVCSFITSAEYQNRFSSVVNHSNGECGR